MAKRTIRHVFYSYPGVNDRGRAATLVARRGDTVDLPDAEIRRGEALGAFEGTQFVTAASSEPVLSQVEPQARALDGGGVGGEPLMAEGGARFPVTRLTQLGDVGDVVEGQVLGLRDGLFVGVDAGAGPSGVFVDSDGDVVFDPDVGSGLVFIDGDGDVAVGV